jgi:flagellar basal body rod protein FlgG
MIRSLYTAASGLVTGLRMQATVAENLANATTTGYKGERAAAREFAGVLARSVGNAPVPVPLQLQTTLGRLGTGAFVNGRRVTLETGTPRSTGQPLDAMIQGEGFFTVQAADGLRYTRDGHFQRSQTNQLVTADGALVLDTNGQPITLATDNVRIDGAGQIFRRDVVDVIDADGLPATDVVETLVGSFGIVTAGADELVRAGASQFTLAPGVQAAPITLGGDSTMLQHTLEESNVQVAESATQLMSLSRAFEASQHVFTTINDTLRAAVQDVGRVSSR